jgi:hypothetical protein
MLSGFGDEVHSVFDIANVLAEQTHTGKVEMKPK